jgi:hypothetical protein
MRNWKPQSIGQAANLIADRIGSCVLMLAALLSGNASYGQTVPLSSPPAFQDQVHEVARLFQSKPQLKKLSQTNREELVNFVAGNMVFVLLHELAHAMVSDLQIPMLGPEEDAADYLATIELLDMASAFSHRVLVDAAEGWFLSHRRDRYEKEPLYFHSEHGLDKQRAYRILCIMVGSDPVQFIDLAEDAKLPEARQQTCRDDYAAAASGWNEVLKAHLRSVDQPKVEINVIYGDGKGKYDVFAQGLRSLRLLDFVAERVADRLAWPLPLTMETQSCGIINAAWLASARKVTLCYELTDDFAHLYRNYSNELTFVSTRRKDYHRHGR